MTDDLERRAQVLHELSDVSDEALEISAALLADDPTNGRATNRLGKRAAALADFVRRPADEVVEPLLAGPGRAAALKFLAFSIRAIQRLDGTRLAVTEIPSDRRFRVVGGIYSAVTPWDGLLCVSIAKLSGAVAGIRPADMAAPAQSGAHGVRARPGRRGLT